MNFPYHEAGIFERHHIISVIITTTLLHVRSISVFYRDLSSENLSWGRDQCTCSSLSQPKTSVRGIHVFSLISEQRIIKPFKKEL